MAASLEFLHFQPATWEMTFFSEIPATSRYRHTGDRFCYMEAGRVGLPPVLLLHGIGASSPHWRFQLTGLADRFRLIAWNAPGYLLSDNLRPKRRAAVIMPMCSMTCYRPWNPEDDRRRDREPLPPFS
ncbi:MAG: hypothetical protein JO139_04740 [Alphaproteobacteria bacterium]|nr:hypothetical protein [Alphaproteobacteria bacterium]MBV8335006.1 hypothetical protein [Alphaproteobacteria bacterium]